jgi:protein SDA1
MDVDENDEAGWSDWEAESEGSTDSSGWEEVSSDGDDDLVISDSDDEAGDKAKKSKSKAATKKTKKDEKEDIEMDDEDDTKSVVSVATTQVSEGTKKLSLLAQQKVSPSQVF